MGKEILQGLGRQKNPWANFSVNLSEFQNNYHHDLYDFPYNFHTHTKEMNQNRSTYKVFSYTIIIVIKHISINELK